MEMIKNAKLTHLDSQCKLMFPLLAQKAESESVIDRIIKKNWISPVVEQSAEELDIIVIKVI